MPWMQQAGHLLLDDASHRCQHNRKPHELYLLHSLLLTLNWNLHWKILIPFHPGEALRIQNLILYVYSVHKIRLPLSFHHTHVHTLPDFSQCHLPNLRPCLIHPGQNPKDSLNVSYITSCVLY